MMNNFQLGVWSPPRTPGRPSGENLQPTQQEKEKEEEEEKEVRAVRQTDGPGGEVDSLQYGVNLRNYSWDPGSGELQPADNGIVGTGLNNISFTHHLPQTVLACQNRRQRSQFFPRYYSRGRWRASCQRPNDLNSLPSNAADAVCSETALGIEPATPNNSRQMEKKGAYELPPICLNEPGSQRERTEGNGNAIARVTINYDGEEQTDYHKEGILKLSQCEDLDRKGIENFDTNKTPHQLKQKRKKHRPKVIAKGKPKHIAKPASLNPTEPKEKPTEIKIYVRRKRLNKPSTLPAEEGTDFTASEPKRKYYRRAFAFDKDEQAQNGNSSSMLKCNSNSESQAQKFHAESSQEQEQAAQMSQAMEGAMVGITGIAHDLSLSENRNLKHYISWSKRSGLAITSPKNDGPEEYVQTANYYDGSYSADQAQSIIHKESSGISEVILCANNQKTPDDSNCITVVDLCQKEQVTRLKRRYSNTLEQAQLTSSNLMGTCQNYLQSGDNMAPGKNFPKTYKKKRTGKATTSATSRVTSSLTWTNMQCMLAPCQAEWFKKKRTRGHTNVHPLALQNQIVEYMQQTPTCGNSHTCFEALVAGTHVMAKKKRTKNGKFIANTMALDTNKGKGKLHKAGIAYSHRGIFTHSQGSLGPIHKNMLPINALVGQFNNLHISGQRNKLAYEEQHALVPCKFRLQESNALVLYERNKAVVPFEGVFGPVKKHDLRPKVDLDEETNRVWRLLLENINSEGIDGIDEEKRKWWENERRVFQGRADSFVARMRLVQGDRSFSKWKGSVLDSVIGVFLTQNVSDHLSSSAFMSLAARFPSPPIRPCHESTSMWVEDPAIGILEPEDTIQLNEDKAAVNRDKSFGCSLEESTLYTSTPLEETGLIEGGNRPIDDTFLSQSSISSVNSSARRIGSCSGGNSKAEDIRIDSILSYFDAPNSFLGLQVQEDTISCEAHNEGNYNMLASQTSECLQYGHQIQVRKRLDHPINLMGVSINHSSNYKLHTTPNSDILEVECKEMLQETQSFNIFKKQDESRVGELSGLTAESISPSPVQTKVSIQEVTAESLSNQRSVQNSTAMNVQEVTAECIRKITGQNIMTVSTQEASRTSNNDNPLCGDPVERSEISEQTEDTKSSVKSKTTNVKREKNQKEKGKAYNWDNLRKKAETSGRKRKRTNDTMDSLDWEAVRLADVNEISNAIKARGMNNVLAGRIKDFLNQLVGQHGSIDLEWLRDVPPDKAKEYLLSVRGLGLKSVECVRLLTLHHLAFPVDTNVGRIAVRLGWVPLQPLPESLQLHLLELYPVLESIQKYLWPRLCKLDQKALYELHYQMITFGKVFCTKSKPNCNACPLRGECRHFASAFASSRLALPGPEENRIVCATERMDEYKSFTQITSPLLLLPQANHDAEAKPEINICEPFIEEPTSPEPDCSQITECDMEDMFREDHNEIPIIELNIQKFTQNLQNYMQNNMELHEGEMSKALVALTPEVASIPVPKLKYVNRLRTEHQVYELPDSHPLVKTLDEREPDDPCPYLLAIWTPGETASSIQVPKRRCNSQESGKLCNDETCLSCNSTREANSQIVRGTLLIPCRTAMRGSFPLNGTYFQVNEVFADHDSSLRPIDVPRSWIWNLTRRTVYFGTSVPSIFKGLSIEDIQQCFWKGYVCVRGFDQKTRAPRPLMARLHFPASKLSRRKDQRGDE